MADDFAPKEGQGSLWKNETPKHDKSPQYTGKITINGQVYKINGFINEAKSSGKKYIGLSARPADEQSTSSDRRSPPSDDGWL